MFFQNTEKSKIDDKRQSPPDDTFTNFLLFLFLLALVALLVFSTLGLWGIYIMLISLGIGLLAVLMLMICTHKSKKEKDFTKIYEKYQKLPSALKERADDKVLLGSHKEIKCPIFLSDCIRSRHVHILGATGTGKTAYVITNLLKQDIERGHPVVLIDGKGDLDFLQFLEKAAPPGKLKVFDLNGGNSCSYNPLLNGTTTEASQRLFHSLNWGEEFYKQTSQTVLAKMFEKHTQVKKAHPNFNDLSQFLQSKENLATCLVTDENDSLKNHFPTYDHVLGLKHQIDHLNQGVLKDLLSPEKDQSNQIQLKKALQNNEIIYFRLPSLTNFETASIVGKLIIADLAYIAGDFQKRGESGKFCPVYLDEFSCFVCNAFRRLIGLARSARMALHYSHQSLGDLNRDDPSFFTTLSDSTATKIALRVGDHTTADYLARTFGTYKDFKVTERVGLDLEDEKNPTSEGMGSYREAQRFNLDPNILKSTHVGEGHALISHGDATTPMATTYVPLKFPPIQK